MTAKTPPASGWYAVSRIADGHEQTILYWDHERQQWRPAVDSERVSYGWRWEGLAPLPIAGGTK